LDNKCELLLNQLFNLNSPLLLVLFFRWWSVLYLDFNFSDEILLLVVLDTIVGQERIVVVDGFLDLFSDTLISHLGQWTIDLFLDDLQDDEFS